ncbi:ExeA family protein [Paraferrimonas sedimenticola]|uniref:ATPase AAA n=1 Tax=Paraferrimonas sedimenticola TaxID=375674 RepID=A0AA37VZI6_9GAMM|nr:ExeA family protein [Paraferrimonas sedimenticola]GLP97239.1 ATPase AAA [Paraferrimonas sedimenticola]
MYQAYYGVAEAPFSIAPNPKYLFLSERHRDALTHLTYGLGETGGFVLLTGEVGTGKTTVSRCLLQQLPEHTDTAFILNPSLTERELLATLCDELSIEYPNEPSLKQLTDCIAEFLQRNHDAGRNTVLIIDEAQHLRAEVLEQLRLLTNLETDTKKLLQVILIGQPELQHLLRRQELRQLAQRITARYHLLPLNVKEVASYVRHRLEVAGAASSPFAGSALKALHKHSGGVPRLINLIAERALLAGFAEQKAKIDKRIVDRAATEVLGLGMDFGDKKPAKWPWALAASLVLVSAIGAGVWWQSSTTTSAQLPSEPVNQAITPVSQTAPQPQTVAPVTTAAQSQANQGELDHLVEEAQDIDLAYAALFERWQQPLYQGLTPCQSAKRNGLACHQQQGNLRTIAQIDRPAVVYLEQAGQRFYGALLSLREQELLLQLGEQQIWVSQTWFERHFRGTFELLWQQPERSLATIGPGSQGEQVQWLEDSLASVAGIRARVQNVFDQELQRQVEGFQRENGLRVDGIAGRETLVQLNLRLSRSGPRLRAG